MRDITRMRNVLRFYPTPMSTTTEPTRRWRFGKLQLVLRAIGELRLCDTLAHSSRRGDTTGDGLHQVVHVVGAAPLQETM